MEISFSGKRALVTGAAQGIGLGVVKKLVECGARVVALDNQEEKLKEAVKELPGVEPIVVDLSDWDSIEKSLKNIGSVQLVVNNAGVACKESILEMEEAVVNRILNVNLKGMMAICKHVVSEWTSTGTQGSIVNIASVVASRTVVGCPAYSASKAGILQYSRCLALDCAPKGIRVNIISPGFVETEMTKNVSKSPQANEFLTRSVPMPEKWMVPEDIANAVAFLLCDKVAGKITGVNLAVDSGFRLT